jgi:hypothetical protein
MQGFRKAKKLQIWQMLTCQEMILWDIIMTITMTLIDVKTGYS